MKKFILRLTTVLWALLCLISSCRNTPYYHHYELMPADGWRADHEVFFSFSEKDSMAHTLHLRGAMRLSPDFPLKQIPIGIVIESPSRQFSTITLQVDLSKRNHVMKSGYNLHEVTFDILPNMELSEEGEYTVSYRQLLSDSIIPGVVELGLIIR